MAQVACFYLSLSFLIIIAPCISSSGKITLKTTQHDEIYPPVTTSPTTPATILPANNPPPTMVTVPSTNPITVTPNPDTTTSPVPITNPVTTPSTTTPVSNPVTTYPSPTIGVPATTPVTNPVAPPVSTGSPAAAGQSWCVVKNGVSEAGIQAALDYACGIAGADCSAIQQGASCYNPNSLKNHASYALNSYYQKNPVQTSCDFGGAGMITTTNPSSGTCIYPASTTPSPTTSSSSGGGSVSGYVTPPSVTNSADGTSGFNSSTSMSICLQPLIGFIILAMSTVTGRLVLYM